MGIGREDVDMLPMGAWEWMEVFVSIVVCIVVVLVLFDCLESGLDKGKQEKELVCCCKMEV